VHRNTVHSDAHLQPRAAHMAFAMTVAYLSGPLSRVNPYWTGRISEISSPWLHAHTHTHTHTSCLKERGVLTFKFSYPEVSGSISRYINMPS